MSSIDRALAWEFFKRCRLFIVIYLLAAIAVPLVFQGIFVLQGLDLAEIELDSRLYFLNFVAISLMAFTGAILASQVEGDSHLPTRLFTLPVSTSRIVAAKMLAAAGMVIAGYLVIVGIYNLWLGTNWPFLTPLLFLVAATAGAQAGGWTLYDFSVKKALATIAAAVALIGSFIYRYTAFERFDNQVIDSNIYLGESILLAMVTVLFYRLAVIAFDCSRRGDCRPWPDLSQLALDAVARRHSSFLCARQDISHARIGHVLVGVATKRVRDPDYRARCECHHSWHCVVRLCDSAIGNRFVDGPGSGIPISRSISGWALLRAESCFKDSGNE